MLHFYTFIALNTLVDGSFISWSLARMHPPVTIQRQMRGGEVWNGGGPEKVEKVEEEEHEQEEQEQEVQRRHQVGEEEQAEPQVLSNVVLSSGLIVSCLHQPVSKWID